MRVEAGNCFNFTNVLFLYHSHLCVYYTVLLTSKEDSLPQKPLPRWGKKISLSTMSPTIVQPIFNVMPVLIDIKNKIELFDQSKEQAGNDKKEPFTLQKQIELQNIFFGYDTNKPILNNLPLSIPAFKITAITGKSGTGKSTLADLLTGLLQPQSGEVVADGKSLFSIGLRNWRNSIAYMPQEVFLSNTSIRNNLLWANPNANEKNMWEALELANVKEHIFSLEKGLDTIVGNRGTRISGRQRQRIALAMALVRKPSLLILDEATNELDKLNEREVLTTIAGLKSKITIVIITHNLSTMRIADKALVIKNREIYTWKEEHPTNKNNDESIE